MTTGASMKGIRNTKTRQGGRRLVVDPLDGGVWLAVQNTLLRFWPTGTAGADISLTEIKGLEQKLKETRQELDDLKKRKSD